MGKPKPKSKLNNNNKEEHIIKEIKKSMFQSTLYPRHRRKFAQVLWEINQYTKPINSVKSEPK